MAGTASRGSGSGGDGVMSAGASATNCRRSPFHRHERIGARISCRDGLGSALPGTPARLVMRLGRAEVDAEPELAHVLAEELPVR